MFLKASCDVQAERGNCISTVGGSTRLHTQPFIIFSHEACSQDFVDFRSQFNLTTDCITFSPSLARPQHLLLRLKSSKTDSFREGKSLVVARCPSLLCPVTAMQQYFRLTQPTLGCSSFFSQVGYSLGLLSCICFGTLPELLGFPTIALKVIVFA